MFTLSSLSCPMMSFSDDAPLIKDEIVNGAKSEHFF